MNTEVEKEIEELTKKLENEPANAAFYDKRAEAYRKFGDYDKMMDDASKSLELDPENPDHLMSYGNALTWLENYEEAIKYLTKAIEKDSLKPYYYMCRGTCYQRLNAKIINGNPDTQNRDGFKKSLEDYGRAIELESDNAFYYYCRGLSYGWIENCEKSHEDFGKAFELQPDNMVYLTWYMLMSQDILLHLGMGLLPFIGNCGSFASKIKNLRTNLKDVLNGSDVYIPIIQIMDNQNIKPYEAIMYADKKVIFQKELSIEKEENVLDEIVEVLEKLFSREYLKTA